MQWTTAVFWGILSYNYRRVLGNSIAVLCTFGHAKFITFKEGIQENFNLIQDNDGEDIIHAFENVASQVKKEYLKFIKNRRHYSCDMNDDIVN